MRFKVLTTFLYCFFVFSSERTANIGTINIEKKWSDIYSEISETVAKNAGYEISSLVMPYPRIKQGLIDGKIDISIMFHSKEVEKYATPIGEVRTKKLVILGRKGVTYKDISDFDNKVITVQRGTHYFEKYKKQLNFTQQLTNSYEQNIRIFMNNRADAIVGSLDSILNITKKLGYDIRHYGEPFLISSKTSWLFLSKKSQLSEAKIRKSFMEASKSGLFKKVIRKHNKVN